MQPSGVGDSAVGGQIKLAEFVGIGLRRGLQAKKIDHFFELQTISPWVVFRYTTIEGGSQRRAPGRSAASERADVMIPCLCLAGDCDKHSGIARGAKGWGGGRSYVHGKPKEFGARVSSAHF